MTATDLYPRGWPRCPVCDEPALDGHITCGSFKCNESDARRRANEQRVRRITDNDECDAFAWTCTCGFYNTRRDCILACQNCGTFR